MSRRAIRKEAAQEEKRRKRVRKRERTRKRRRRLLLITLAGGGAYAASRYLQKPVQGSGTVVLEDEEPGVLSTMMGQMLEGFMQDPAKKAVADRMRVSVAIQDIDNPEIATTMIFEGSDVRVKDGVIPDVQIFIGTEMGLLLAMAGAGKGLEMIKFLGTDEGKEIINALKTGRMQIRGVARRPMQMMQFQKFLTPPA